MSKESNHINFCDLTCKYAKFPDVLADGARTCRTFFALYCKKKKRLVYKNAPCKEYTKRKGGFK